MQHRKYTGIEIANILQAKLVSPNPEDIQVFDILIDSRRLIAPEGAIFFALQSKRNDGHLYIGSLYKKGVRNFVVSRLNEEQERFPEASFFVVNSTLTALQRLTSEHRKHFNIPVIGITGSNGKTIVKEWLFQLMHPDKNIVRSPKSYNSQIGVPLSVWQMNETHEMALFEAQELEVYLNDYSFTVSDSSKTIYEEFVPLDSGVESKFAKDCESSDQIKFYFKLPNWFKIPTPIGNYNPDWALVFEDDKKIYFVAETKDTGTPQVDLSKLGGDEQMKIKCGKAHFNEFDDLEYKVVNKVGQLIE